ncbi:hypothetical protein BDI4_210011 [Burkholderia diffusa]|nr:hypothetical protein BDI4_210011 [Burkholderia diffusa]
MVLRVTGIRKFVPSTRLLGTSGKPSGRKLHIGKFCESPLVNVTISTTSFQHHIAYTPFIIEQYAKDRLSRRCIRSYRLIEQSVQQSHTSPVLECRHLAHHV